MLIVFNTLIQFIKKPNCGVLQISPAEKIKMLTLLLLIAFISSFTLGIFISILSYLGVFDVDSHAITKLLEEKSKVVVFLVAVVAAPVFEELVFRAPIPLFCDKKQFKNVFYAFAIVFGFIHLSNYKVTPIVVLVSPILIAPQIALGLILGFVRIKLGLAYSILLHAFFNGLLIVPSLLFMDKAL